MARCGDPAFGLRRSRISAKWPARDPEGCRRAAKNEVSPIRGLSGKSSSNRSISRTTRSHFFSSTSRTISAPRISGLGKSASHRTWGVSSRMRGPTRRESRRPPSADENAACRRIVALPGPGRSTTDAWPVPAGPGRAGRERRGRLVDPCGHTPSALAPSTSIRRPAATLMGVALLFARVARIVWRASTTCRVVGRSQDRSGSGGRFVHAGDQGQSVVEDLERSSGLASRRLSGWMSRLTMPP